MSAQVLIIDDNEKFRGSLSRSLMMRKYLCFGAASSSQAFDVLSKNTIHIILLDLKLGEEDGEQVAKSLMLRYPSIPIIVITGFATIDSAVSVMKSGVVDYIQKPIDITRLVRTIENVLKVSQGSNKQKPSLDYYGTTKSEKMQKCMHLVDQLAKSEIPILLLGESGTGKEVIAEYIHKNSPRSGKVLQKVNCASFSETLLDSELFGHRKGAFTGAVESHKGIFERSDKGSLFLDEIGDMPTSLQAKILRALQNQEILPLGGEATIKVDVRFLSATNKNIVQMVEQGEFRKDLYYRLAAGVIQLPPLRERKEDILSMSSYFISRYASTPKTISKQLEGLFFAYPWPGNIRELMNVIQYACLVSSADTITMEDLPSSFLSNLQKREIIADDSWSLEKHEEEVIKSTLTKFNNNKKEAAEVLKISRSTLYSKLKKFSQHDERTID